MISSLSLGTWPTPIDEAPRLAARAGLARLWIKRDDLVGLGGGGNKVRKLEITCAEAIAAGASTLVTTGAPQSNHARLTAAAAARLGMRCVLVLVGGENERPGGNLLLDDYAGAEIVWAGDRPTDDVAAEVDGYLIPFGGTSATSVQGYERCGRELLEQVADFDAVVVALGSGGTMAGLVRELGPQRVVGVDTGVLSEPRATVAALVGAEIDPALLRIDRSRVGQGYGYYTRAARNAVAVAARTEGIFLDPTYTGRAMAALLAGGIGQNLVFLHSGGLPGLFSPPPSEHAADVASGHP
ncbi:pyridoxal-phosphate dependent enzyme [Plantactinospora sp. WMMC1484]|uniref:pyridoxal-phosphate dependent enzyme n=1 Tax=Plantactinospora sp. WMMC1484 TaxID=3404122 RepID=UPI003BF54C2F